MELNEIITTEKGIFMKEKERDFFYFRLPNGKIVGIYYPDISVGGYLHEGRTWMITEKLISEEEFIRLLEKENSK